MTVILRGKDWYFHNIADTFVGLFLSLHVLFKLVVSIPSSIQVKTKMHKLKEKILRRKMLSWWGMYMINLDRI